MEQIFSEGGSVMFPIGGREWKVTDVRKWISTVIIFLSQNLGCVHILQHKSKAFKFTFTKSFIKLNAVGSCCHVLQILYTNKKRTKIDHSFHGKRKNGQDFSSGTGISLRCGKTRCWGEGQWRAIILYIITYQLGTPNEMIGYWVFNKWKQTVVPQSMEFWSSEIILKIE